MKLRFGVSGSRFKLKSSHRKRDEADDFTAGGKPRAKKSKKERRRIRKRNEDVKRMDHSDDRIAGTKRR